MQVCAGCGAENPARAKFCLECGSALSVHPDAPEARKTVTVLFCDVTGSTALGERLDAEAMRAVMSRYFAEMSRVVESHGGTVEKFIGDAVMAVFGVPTLHEDDALRALRAAAGMRTALTVLNEGLDRDHGVRLAVRIGVNTGEVVVGTGTNSKGTVATGDAVNVAARLQSAAQPGEVLFGAPTWSLVRASTRAEPTTPLQLKGKSGAVPAWRLLGVDGVDDADPDAGRAGRESPLVGRGGEVALLTQTFDRCIAGRRPQLVTVLGAAGVGKSRLMAEVLDVLGNRSVVLSGRCLSYGDDIAFWPLRQMLRELVGFGPGDTEDAGRRGLRSSLGEDAEADRVVERLAPLAGFGGTPAEAEETHWALRRLVEDLGRERPVVLVLDDVHWAEPALLDVVDHLADWTRDTALLLVCLARPEFLDDRPQWGGGKVNAATVLLEPLPESAAGALIDNLLAGTHLDAAVRGRILDAAGGTPLFVEQMLAMLADDGMLVPGDQRPGMPPRAIDVPAGVTALLSARLDRLPPDERAALEAASVVGLTFYRNAVTELTDLTGAHSGTVLMALARKELVRPDRSDLPGQDGFRFLHVLVRDAAYTAMPKARRAEVHERFARWLDKQAEASGDDADEFVGHHLEQAVLLRRELGPQDAKGAELAEAAALRLVAAAARLGAADPASAASLYERAGELVDRHDVRRVDHLRAAAASSLDGGALARGRDLYRRAGALAAELGDERRTKLCRLDLMVAAAHLSAGALSLAEIEEARQAQQEFRAAGDTEGTLRAGLVVLFHLNTLAVWAPVADLARELLDTARALGDDRTIAVMTQYVGAALFFGPAPIEESLDWTGQVLVNASRSVESGRTYARAAALACTDREDEARTTLRRADELARDLDNPVAAGVAAFGGGHALILLGEWAEADRVIRHGVDSLRGLGERGWLPSLLPLLGEVSWQRGDVEGARAAAEESREISSQTDANSQAGWRALLARVEAVEGHIEQARVLADEAVSLLARTDEIGSQADALVARAEVLDRAGQPHEAERDLTDALALYDRKGNRPRARQVRALLAGRGVPG